MGFNHFVPPLLNREQSGALPDLVGEFLTTYTNAAKAKNLKPKLREALTKAQLENKYYGRDKESEIGLRGAQSNYLGEQAKYHGANINSEIAHRAALNELTGEQARNYSANSQSERDYRSSQQELTHEQAAKMHNDSIMQAITDAIVKNKIQESQQGESGNARNAQQGQPETPQFSPVSPNNNNMATNIAAMLNPNANAPHSSIPPQQQQQPAMENEPRDNEDNYERNGTVPKYTAQDAVNKRVFGVDTFKAKYDAYIKAQTAGMEKKEALRLENEAKKEFKDYERVATATADLPVLRNTLAVAEQMRDIVKNNPDMWGHRYKTEYYAQTGQSANPFNWTAPNKLVGTFQTELVPLIAENQQKLSSKGNQVALKLAASKVPSYADNQVVALGKMDGVVAGMKRKVAENEQLAGGNIQYYGKDKYQEIDGNWYKVKSK